MSIFSSPPDELILCATSRLAQHLRARRPADAVRIWATAPVMTTGQWLSALAEKAFLAGLLPEVIELTGEAAMVAWETVLASQLPGGHADLFDRRGLAIALRDADALCVAWNIDPARHPGGEETRFFIAVREAFGYHCRSKGWIDTARLQQMVLDLIEAGRLGMPARLRFAGFDRLSPVEQRLLRIGEKLGSRVDVEVANPPPNSVELLSLECDDIAVECHAVAAWAATELENRPTIRLGVVAPDLAAVRAPLAAVLDARLHPELVRPAAAETPRRYNFSLGDPLAAVPLVRCALDWLAVAVAAGRVEQAAISSLLCSPYWANEAEADARALADAFARRRLGFHTSLEAVARFLDRPTTVGNHARMPVTSLCLTRLTEALRAVRGRLLPSRWGEHFMDWLERLRWPGDRSLSSHEYQARQAFLETLAQLASLDEPLGPVAAAEALARLRRIAGEKIFQPQGSGDANIQILGVLESAGLEFDALWVMGMNDHVWPPAPRPNPFLPAPLQRALGTPHASAEVELEFARSVHERLVRAAPRVRFSFSRLEGERVLRPSPLLAGISSERDVAVSPATPLMNRLVRLPDWQAPPVGAGEAVAGGSALLKAQAICPAWGFYAFRLGARALESPVEGLDARARGSLVHAVLECFWKVMGDSARLAACNASQRAAAITAAVEAGLARFEADHNQVLPPRFRASEARRLGNLLDRWLAVEASRQAPFAVVASEQETTIALCGLQLRVIVDRIDRLVDGRSLIIDYKTGRSVDTKNWSQPRLTEPQLPLYVCEAATTLSEAGTPAGAVFAKVHVDDARFHGITADGDLLPGVAAIGDAKQRIFERTAFPDWAAVLQHWSAALTAVAAEVRDGIASVSFADEVDLQYCDVKPLLRLPERAWQAAQGRGEES